MRSRERDGARLRKPGLTHRFLVLGLAGAAPAALALGLLVKIILNPPSDEPVDSTPMFTPPTTCHGGTVDTRTGAHQR